MSDYSTDNYNVEFGIILQNPSVLSKCGTSGLWKKRKLGTEQNIVLYYTITLSVTLQTAVI